MGAVFWCDVRLMSGLLGKIRRIARDLAPVGETVARNWPRLAGHVGDAATLAQRVNGRLLETRSSGEPLP